MTPTCPNPVFIIGAPRSGTTALAWSLAKHPAFWTAGESQILLDLFGDGELERNYARASTLGGSFLAQNGVERDAFLGYVGVGLNALFTSCSGGRRWIDKTPANTLIASVIADLFPGALFLHILRDGRQVVHSMLNFATLGSRSHLESMTEPWMHDFRAACITWREHVQAALRFEAEHPDRCLTVAHDRLVDDPLGSFERIFSFLGAEPNDAPAEHIRTHLLNSSFADDGSDPAARDRLAVTTLWRRWPAGRREIFREEAGDTLAAAGLARDDDLIVHEVPA
jgi:hypothetical protein